MYGVSSRTNKSRQLSGLHNYPENSPRSHPKPRRAMTKTGTEDRQVSVATSNVRVNAIMGTIHPPTRHTKVREIHNNTKTIRRCPAGVAKAMSHDQLQSDAGLQQCTYELEHLPLLTETSPIPTLFMPHKRQSDDNMIKRRARRLPRKPSENQEHV